MIPQKKIDQAAKDVNFETRLPSITAFNTAFTAGVRFAESEMGQIAQEFAEWCAKNAYSSYESNQINWTIPEGKWCIADQSNVIPEFSTTSDLFAKFMAERNK